MCSDKVNELMLLTNTKLFEAIGKFSTDLRAVEI